MPCMAERRMLARDLTGYIDGHFSAGDMLERLSVFAEARDSAVRAFAADFDAVHGEKPEWRVRPLPRGEWNALQRMFLFLRSDLEFDDADAAREGRRREWGAGQATAALGLIVATGVWMADHPQAFFLCFAIAAACLAVRIPRLMRRPEQPAGGFAPEVVYPFASFRQLARQRRRDRGFAKARYPHAWKAPAAEPLLPRVVGVLTAVFFCMTCWPVVLLLLCLPTVADSRDAGERDLPLRGEP